MYHKFTTSALVLAVYKKGETASAVVLLTRDWGRVVVSAQGLRSMKSKLRYSLTQFSRCRVTLVRGRGGWRLVSAESYGNIFSELRDKPEAGTRAARVINLCDKLMDESRESREVFDTISTGLDFMRYFATDEEIAGIERIILLRVLWLEGWLTRNGVCASFLNIGQWDKGLVRAVNSVSGRVTREINRSLAEMV